MNPTSGSIQLQSVPPIFSPSSRCEARIARHSAIVRIVAFPGAGSKDVAAIGFHAFRADFIPPQPSPNSNRPLSVPVNSALKYHNSQ